MHGSTITSSNAESKRRNKLALTLPSQNTRQVLEAQWKQSIEDGLLDSINSAIEAMADIASQIQNAKTNEDIKVGSDLLSDYLAYTARTLQRILSFYSVRKRFVKPNFKLTDLIEAATSQFLPLHCHQASKIIWDYDFDYFYKDTESMRLTQLEKEYLEFVTPRLISSLLWDAYPDVEMQENVQENIFESMWI